MFQVRLYLQVLRSGTVVGEQVLWTGALPVSLEPPAVATGSGASGTAPRSALRRLARDLEVSPATLEAGCRPGSQPPYLRLDPLHLERFAALHAQAGPRAISPIQVAATHLCLWLPLVREEPPTIRECLAVLRATGREDRNARRSLDTCRWLSREGNGVILEPRHRARALSLARAFLLETWDPLSE